MPEKVFTGAISATVVETDEEPFIPGKAIKIEAILEPLEEPPTPFFPSTWINDYNNIIPPFLPSFPDLPEFEAPGTELIINIETTGVKPWESRIIAIGVLDPNQLEPQAMNFIEETEEKTLDAFIQFWKSTNYTTLIGYNVSFDYRFLYALMQKYRKTVETWKETDLYDLMQQQKQVKNEFVFGFNPTGKLEEWTTYLFGTKPYAEQKQVFAWYKEKNVEEIVNFNTDKLLKAYLLWVLDKVVSGNISGSEVIARPSTQTAETPQGSHLGEIGNPNSAIQVKCTECLQEQEMLKTDKVINCHVCNTPISNPAA